MTRFDSLSRAQLERAEDWNTAISQMPYLRFPADWEVRIIPPFGGAIARFIVRRGEASVSVYADFHEALGCWAVPHWEICPDAEDNNARFSIADETAEMLAAIGQSLEAQASTNPSPLSQKESDNG